MKILAIETSCDETAIAVVECKKHDKDSEFRILGNTLLSQIDLHKKYGGVFPTLAKREHAKNLIPILTSTLKDAELLRDNKNKISEEKRAVCQRQMAREHDLGDKFLEFASKYGCPEIDAIAVTAGPGLEPALWVGINFAKALSVICEKPIIATNHMEGHIFSALAQRDNEKQFSIRDLRLPILGLLISGGHTELVLMKEWLKYELVGQTRDDAVGEAFDKVARMLSLPYPGGPEISKLAEEMRRDVAYRRALKLPRPMIRENNCDFSFAGLKTAVMYLLKNIPDINEEKKKHIAHEFENAAADVLWHKTARALNETGAKMLVIGGGVSSNIHIKRVFTEKIREQFKEVILRVPNPELATDNAIMIAMAGFYRAEQKEFALSDIIANGNLSLA